MFRGEFFLALLVLATSACGSDSPAPTEPTATDESAAVTFGADDTRCASVRLHNDTDDQQVLQDAMKCFFAEMESGEAIVVDVDRPTVEGDSIFVRHDFDGTSVLIITDSRLDSFGSGSVDARRCTSVVSTEWLPEGVGCEPVDHVGFADAVR